MPIALPSSSSLLVLWMIFWMGTITNLVWKGQSWIDIRNLDLFLKRQEVGRHCLQIFCVCLYLWPSSTINDINRQGCIFCLTCSYPELTKDNVLTSVSWCQSVSFFNSWWQIVRCQIVLQSETGTIFFISNIYITIMKNKKKRSFILMRTQIGFNLKCIAQCICSKSSGLTFLDNVWFGMFERSLRPVLRVADSP